VGIIIRSRKFNGTELSRRHGFSDGVFQYYSVIGRHMSYSTTGMTMNVTELMFCCHCFIQCRQKTEDLDVHQSEGQSHLEENLSMHMYCSARVEEELAVRTLFDDMGSAYKCCKECAFLKLWTTAWRFHEVEVYADALFTAVYKPTSSHSLDFPHCSQECMR
jgi:hypothetical protein